MKNQTKKETLNALYDKLCGAAKAKFELEKVLRKVGDLLTEQARTDLQNAIEELGDEFISTHNELCKVNRISLIQTKTQK